MLNDKALRCGACLRGWQQLLVGNEEQEAFHCLRRQLLDVVVNR